MRGHSLLRRLSDFRHCRLYLIVASAALLPALLSGHLIAGPQAGAKSPSKGPSRSASEDTLRTRLEINPHDADAHKQLIEVLRKRWLPRALVIEDATWIKNNPGDYWVLTELVSYAKTGLDDPEFAIQEERAFLSRAKREEDDLDYDRAMDQLATDLDLRGKSEESLKIYDELVRLNPEDASLWGDRSYPLISLGRVDEAIQSLRRSLEIDPASEMTHQILGDALVTDGDLNGAETEYRAALSLYAAKYKNGETTNSFDDLIKTLVKSEAQGHMETILAEMHLRLARALMLEKDYESAIAETQAALDANNTELVALYLRGEIYDAKGDHESATRTRELAKTVVQRQATSEFSKSSPKDRPQIDPRVLFLTDTLWNGESGYPALPSETVSILEPRIDSLSAYEHSILAISYFALKRAPEAKVQWEKAIAMDPKLDTAKGNANLGRELLKARSFSDALPHLRRAYELDPRNMTYRIDYELAQRK
jgi:tetratricopeptide (TPR) repeat protein